MAVVCQQCGRRNERQAQFCGNQECGAYLGWQAGGTVRGTVAPGTPVVLSLSDRQLAVAPGQVVSTTASVHNGGSQVEQFRVTVLGPAAGWATVEPAALPVYPGEQAQCTIRFAPPRDRTAPAGQAWFTIRAASSLHPQVAAEAQGSLAVGAFRQLGAVLHPRHTSGRLRTSARLELTNSGNALEPVRLQARDAAGRLRFQLPSDEVPVAPGSRWFKLVVRAPKRLFGRRRAYPFQLTVAPRPPAAPIQLDGDREAIPLLAGCLPKLLLLLVLIVVVAVCALIAAAGGDPGPGFEFE